MVHVCVQVRVWFPRFGKGFRCGLRVQSWFLESEFVSCNANKVPAKYDWHPPVEQRELMWLFHLRLSGLYGYQKKNESRRKPFAYHDGLGAVNLYHFIADFNQLIKDR